MFTMPPLCNIQMFVAPCPILTWNVVYFFVGTPLVGPFRVPPPPPPICGFNVFVDTTTQISLQPLPHHQNKHMLLYFLTSSKLFAFSGHCCRACGMLLQRSHCTVNVIDLHSSNSRLPGAMKYNCTGKICRMAKILSYYQWGITHLTDWLTMLALCTVCSWCMRPPKIWLFEKHISNFPFSLEMLTFKRNKKWDVYHLQLLFITLSFCI